ncbi:MAG: VOC family protein [Halodesulfurarchaeum sp.]
MDALAIDHANLRIPPDSIDEALDFYVGKLGFEAEGLSAFEQGELPFVAIRLTDRSTIHLWPETDFEPPGERNFDHLAIHLEDSEQTIRETLSGANIVDQREVLGASGWAQSFYVRDPFGYLLELKSKHGPEFG